jgi:hypothetical protein
VGALGEGQLVHAPILPSYKHILKLVLVCLRTTKARP